MSKPFKTEALESIHESASALHAIGAIGKTTMRQFDEACIAPVPANIPAEQIKCCASGATSASRSLPAT